MPRHVPSSFVASDNKEVRHVIAQGMLLPNAPNARHAPNARRRN